MIRFVFNAGPFTADLQLDSLHYDRHMRIRRLYRGPVHLSSSSFSPRRFSDWPCPSYLRNVVFCA